MVVKSIKNVTGKKLTGGSLPDIDLDFEGRHRPMIKDFINKTVGEKQVSSVGTTGVIKIKGAVKDFDRLGDNDAQTANLITKIIKDAELSLFDVFRLSAQEPKLKEYIKSNTDFFYMMGSVMGQTRSQSTHACAIISFPEVMEAKEYVPLRKDKGVTLTQWSGGALDSAGFLKLDVLGVKVLEKFSDIKRLILKNGKEFPDIYNLGNYDDKEVYRYFGNGWNSDVFQFGSDLIADFTGILKPTNLNDLIATNALIRPGARDNGYHTSYSKRRNGEEGSTSLFMSESVTDETYGLLVYQEQVMAYCALLGDLTENESDDIRRAMGKKNVIYLNMWKDRVKVGAIEKGCEESEFEKIWDTLMEFAKYSFNKSHSAAYAKEGYACQYLKVHFPIEYWTVALDRADEKEKLMYMSEINAIKGTKILPPDVNKSIDVMSSDMDTNTIYWGISSIKGIGEAAGSQILKIREDDGIYLSFDDFIKRNSFTGSKVNKGHIESLCACGAFDELENLEGYEVGRLDLIATFREFKKIKLSAKQFAKDPYNSEGIEQPWWWKLRQKRLTGLAFIDYRELLEVTDTNQSFASGSDLNTPQGRGIPRAFGGYVVECTVRSSARGRWASLLIESNYKTYRVTLWGDAYQVHKHLLGKGIEKTLILFSAELKFNERFGNNNQFTVSESDMMQRLG